MVSTLDINTNALIDAAKEELKTVEALKKPEWAHYAKSGAHKERPPQNDDFWQIRAAALMRKLYKKGPIGVSRLRKEYGGRKNRGAKPE
nr:40S ribosomal protein S19 [Candidatus Undinarchaeales archaeon ERR594346 U_76725]